MGLSLSSLFRISKGAVSLQNIIPVLRVEAYEVEDMGVREGRKEEIEDVRSSG